MESKLKKPRISMAACGDPSDKKDRISDLPDPILHYILSLSSPKTMDVVRTSVLGRQWRYLWNSIPYLDLDLENFFWPRLNNLVMDYGRLTEAFQGFINWVLINGSSDYKMFRLSCSDLYDAETVARWVIVATQRNVQELDLQFSPSNAFDLPYCLLTSKSLRVLKLNLFLHVLKLPRSIGFSRLTSLDLMLVELPDEQLPRKLFLNCPFLESLSLVSCVLNKLKVLDISATNLKFLTIDNNCMGLENSDAEDGLSKSKLKVSCPKLISFKYLGPLAQEYSLDNLSSLSYAFFYLIHGYEKTPFEEVGYLLCKALQGLYHATVLKLCMYFLEVCICSL